MQKKLAAAHQTLRGPMLSSAIFAARAIMTPAEFYDEFSPSLAAKGKKDRSAALTEVLTSETDRVFLWHRSGVAYHDRGRRTTPLRELDPRWVDIAVEAQSLDLVCRLARPGNDKANRLLSEQLAKMKEPHEVQRVLHTMVRIGHPGAVDAVIDALRKQAKERTHYYLGYWYGRLIAELPRSAYSRFEELIPTLPEKMADQLMESILALKNKPE